MRDWRVEFADGTTCYVSNADMHGVADYLAMHHSKVFHRVDAVIGLDSCGEVEDS